MSRISRALGHVFGQRRRYAVVGVLAYRGPSPVRRIALLVRTPAFVVRRDIAKIQRAGLAVVVDPGERNLHYRLTAAPAQPGDDQDAYLEERLGPRPTLDTWLTTFQAADIAGVSRAEIMRLLDAGEISWERPGRHRLIRCRDLITYLQADDTRRKQAADELSRLGQEIGDEPLHASRPGGH
jgi:excisionase family DNA binding protein